MPKYIERSELPQFKYYNFCKGKAAAWEMGAESMWAKTQKGFQELKNPSYIDILEADMRTLATSKDKEAIQDVRDRWFINPGKAEEDIKRLCGAYIDAFIKDDHIKEKWTKRFVGNIIDSAVLDEEDDQDIIIDNDSDSLAYIYEIVVTASHLAVCQGFPLILSDGEEYVPKLLLIKSEIYNALRKNKDLVLDYDTIRKGLETEAAVIAVNGDSHEKKMVFELFAKKDDPVISINMFDPNNGLSSFRLAKNVSLDSDIAQHYKEGNPLKPDDAILYCTRWLCHPRGSWICDENENDNVCVYGKGVCSCAKRSLNIVAAVLYCYQEYLKTNNTEYSKPNKQSSANLGASQARPFVPSGMMRLYDVKLSAEEKAMFNKFSLFGGRKSQYASTEKCPHTRRGTMRYNPKTGQKDIKVKGSVIHKDRYEGFASAERVTA